MDNLSPIETFLWGGTSEDEFLLAVDRIIAEGSETDRTILVQDWRTKSGRIRAENIRRRLDERLRPLSWTAGEARRHDDAGPTNGPRASLRVGDVLAGRFVIEAVLGSGGMGSVFKAIDLRRQEALDRNPYVAIKTLTTDVLDRADSVQILQREARKAQSLSHPNIVRVYDYDRDGAILYLTMELLEGVSLEKTILNTRPMGMTLGKLLPVLEQIASAVQYAHDEGIIHYDLKPANVIILSNGRVKVIDFGIARAAPKADSLTTDRTSFDIGALGALTLAYASPEMIEGSVPDPRDDVFGLACIIYECLAGRHPFGRAPASAARAVNMTPAKPTGLEAHQWKALQRGLHFDRSQRTPSVKQLFQELSARKRGWSPMDNRFAYAGAIGVVAIGIIGWTAYYFLGTSHINGNRIGGGTDGGHLASSGPNEISAPATNLEAAREAQQKAAADTGARLVQQEAVEEAARQAKQQAAAAAAQKALDEKAAEAERQQGAREQAAREAQQKAAADTAARLVQQQAAEEAARQAQQNAAAAAAQQARQKVEAEVARQSQQKADSERAAQIAAQKASAEKAADAARQQAAQEQAAR
jgi:predicted Ser/Thr protein kinase